MSLPASESIPLLRAQEVPGPPKDTQVMSPALRKFRGRRDKKNPRSQFSEISASAVCPDVQTKEVPKGEGSNRMRNITGSVRQRYVCARIRKSVHCTWMARTSLEAPESLLSLPFCTWCFGHGQTVASLSPHSLPKSSSALLPSWIYLPQQHRLHKEYRLKSCRGRGMKMQHKAHQSLFHNH